MAAERIDSLIAATDVGALERRLEAQRRAFGDEPNPSLEVRRDRLEAIVDLIREIAWLMEWSGDLASAELADRQREICRWRPVWLVEQVRHILALRAFQMSNQIFEWSGLLEQATSETKQTP